MSPIAIPRLEYDFKITIKLIVTVKAVPPCAKIENIGMVTEDILRRIPILSFACLSNMGSVIVVSPEKKAARIGAIPA